jgi:hypothetical protein
LFEAPEVPFEGFVRRRDSKRRNQRITAGAVGVAVFVAAIWIVTTGGPFDRTQTPAGTDPAPNPSPVTDQAFVCLPPEGAEPSTPEHGELALSFWGRAAGVNSWIYVYEDGRSIWAKESFPYGASRSITGWLERRLTPKGVERMRNAIVSSGRRFEGAPDLAAGGPISSDAFFNPKQAKLTHPWSWLPASAWEETRARTYVPSRYAVCSRDQVDPTDIASLLPSTAREILPAEDWGLTPSGRPEESDQPTLRDAFPQTS